MDEQVYLEECEEKDGRNSRSNVCSSVRVGLIPAMRGARRMIHQEYSLKATHVDRYPNTWCAVCFSVVCVRAGL